MPLQLSAFWGWTRLGHGLQDAIPAKLFFDRTKFFHYGGASTPCVSDLGCVGQLTMHVHINAYSHCICLLWCDFLLWFLYLVQFFFSFLRLFLLSAFTKYSKDQASYSFVFECFLVLIMKQLNIFDLWRRMENQGTCENFKIPTIRHPSIPENLGTNLFLMNVKHLIRSLQTFIPVKYHCENYEISFSVFSLWYVWPFLNLFQRSDVNDFFSL